MVKLLQANRKEKTSGFCQKLRFLGFQHGLKNQNEWRQIGNAIMGYGWGAYRVIFVYK